MTKQYPIFEGSRNKDNRAEGCGVLFKSGSGIIICGESRVDGNKFLCKRCLEELSIEPKGRDKE